MDKGRFVRNNLFYITIAYENCMKKVKELEWVPMSDSLIVHILQGVLYTCTFEFF